MTISRTAPRLLSVLPANRSLATWALCWASPPIRESLEAVLIPKSVGSNCCFWTPSGLTNHSVLVVVVVSSSRPSFPLKTSPKRPLSANSWAISGAISAFATPSEVAIGWAGFAKGPRKLKVVGTPSCFLIGATCLMAGWNTGAKKNVIPVSLNTSATR